MGRAEANNLLLIPKVIKMATKYIEQLQQKISEYLSDMATQQARIKELEEENTSVKKELTRQRSQVRKLKTDVTKCKNELKKLQEEAKKSREKSAS